MLHYLWLVKQDISAPLIYGGVLVLLLVLRLPWGAPCCVPRTIVSWLPRAEASRIVE